MSQENAEIVRSAFAEFERGNFWVGNIFDPNVRIVCLDALAGGETESLGIESMAATVQEWLRTWERMTTTAERITVVKDQVLVIATWRGRGITSGAPAEWRHGQVWTNAYRRRALIRVSVGGRPRGTGHWTRPKGVPGEPMVRAGRTRVGSSLSRSAGLGADLGDRFCPGCCDCR
jgi:hypothetical protein